MRTLLHACICILCICSGSHATIQYILFDLDGVLVSTCAPAGIMFASVIPEGNSVRAYMQRSTQSHAATCQYILFTNANTEYLNTIRKFPDIDAICASFDMVYPLKSLGLKKPHERAYSYIMEDLDASASEFLLIDDSSRNIAAAKAHGMHTIHFRRNKLPQIYRALEDLGFSFPTAYGPSTSLTKTPSK